jgi:hypothetical protein
VSYVEVLSEFQRSWETGEPETGYFSPTAFVALGGELPPNRPAGPACILKRAGEPPVWVREEDLP